jgi:hypothetical protein
LCPVHVNLFLHKSKMLMFSNYKNWNLRTKNWNRRIAPWPGWCPSWPQRPAEKAPWPTAKTLEQLRADNQRLRDENGALIRVISKLSKWATADPRNQTTEILNWLTSVIPDYCKAAEQVLMQTRATGVTKLVTCYIE